MISAWLQHPLILSGSVVELRPLEEASLEELFAVASDQELWRLTSVNYSDRAVFDASFRTALRDRHLGHVYPFVVCLRDSGRIVGTTRYTDIQPQDRKLEIGVTWLARECWSTGINTECKQLLLAHAFETLGANRVQFRTKSDNARSRRALEKIGAVLEGVMRMDKIEASGLARNTTLYSIVREEWPAVKLGLIQRGFGRDAGQA